MRFEKLFLQTSNCVFFNDDTKRLNHNFLLLLCDLYLLCLHHVEHPGSLQYEVCLVNHFAQLVCDENQQPQKVYGRRKPM